MIFSGDFIYPFNDRSVVFQLGESFIGKPKVLNFESTLIDLNGNRRYLRTGLFSSRYSLDVLRFLNVKCAALANNHVTDFSFDVDKFVSTFKENGIEVIGFGKNKDEAAHYYVSEKEGLVVLNFGWQTIKCEPAGVKKRGVNPYRYAYVEKEVKRIKVLQPDKKLVLFLHWNYEFENLPLPADRMFAHHLIDLGVDVIIGHHPHIINSLEIYKEKPIFYSLGNFYFPQVKYGDVQVSFREKALWGISVDYLGDLEKTKVYLHKQQADGSKIDLLGCYDIKTWYETSYNIPLNGISDRDYLCFYRQNHFHKKKLLPIYTDYQKVFLNGLYDNYVLFRQKFIDLIH